MHVLLRFIFPLYNLYSQFVLPFLIFLYSSLHRHLAHVIVCISPFRVPDFKMFEINICTRFCMIVFFGRRCCAGRCHRGVIAATLTHWINTRIYSCTHHSGRRLYARTDNLNVGPLSFTYGTKQNQDFSYCSIFCVKLLLNKKKKTDKTDIIGFLISGVLIIKLCDTWYMLCINIHYVVIKQ